MNILYYFFKASLVLAYLAVMTWSFMYNLAPLLKLYGGWSWLGTNLLIFIAGYAVGFLFWAVSKPINPQANYRPKTGASS